MQNSRPTSEHPTTRPTGPEHPMVVEGCVTAGDTRLMTQCLIEELLLLGTTADAIREMALRPNFQALFAARWTLGGEVFDELLMNTASRVGIHRTRVQVTTQEPPDLPDYRFLAAGPFHGGD